MSQADARPPPGPITVPSKSVTSLYVSAMGGIGFVRTKSRYGECWARQGAGYVWTVLLTSLCGFGFSTGSY